jgi:hypothetical protein
LVWAGRDESGISDGSDLEFLVSLNRKLYFTMISDLLIKRVLKVST